MYRLNHCVLIFLCKVIPILHSVRPVTIIGLYHLLQPATQWIDHQPINLVVAVTTSSGIGVGYLLLMWNHQCYPTKKVVGMSPWYYHQSNQTKTTQHNTTMALYTLF